MDGATITAAVEVPQGGAEGMLVTMDCRFGGYGLYVLKGKSVFTYNLVDLARFRWEGAAALTPRKHTIVFDFKYEAPAPARAEPASCRWTASRLPAKRSRTPSRS